MVKKRERETRNFGYDIERELGIVEGPKHEGPVPKPPKGPISGVTKDVDLKSRIEKLEELLDDANNVLTDAASHTIETCDAIEECYVCDWQRRFEKYFKEKHT